MKHIWKMIFIVCRWSNLVVEWQFNAITMETREKSFKCTSDASSHLSMVIFWHKFLLNDMNIDLKMPKKNNQFHIGTVIEIPFKLIKRKRKKGKRDDTKWVSIPCLNIAILFLNWKLYVCVWVDANKQSYKAHRGKKSNSKSISERIENRYPISNALRKKKQIWWRWMGKSPFASLFVAQRGHFTLTSQKYLRYRLNSA